MDNYVVVHVSESPVRVLFTQNEIHTMAEPKKFARNIVAHKTRGPCYEYFGHK